MSILEPVDLLMEMVRFPSLSREEGPIVEWLEQYVRGTGLLDVERYGDNLVFSYGAGRPWLLLNSHTDVVPPSSDHHGEPFNPVIKDGRIWGRGTTDAKGCGSTMLTAVLQIAAEKIPIEGRVSVALTICEETYGDYNGMSHLRGHIAKPDAALVGEPTSLAPCVAQKGLLMIEMITHGESGHAARVYGRNAIVEMAEVIKNISKLKFETENPFIGPVKITPTILKGGSVGNMNPEKSSLMLDIRTIPEVPQSEIVAALETCGADEVKVYSDRLKSVETSPDEAIAQAALKASGQDFFGSPTASDWVFLADVPTVKIGPGHSQQSHTRDESIEIEQLLGGVDVYKKTILNYFNVETR